jgi:ATP phosphoribosyltransferase regulatory subunit
VTPKSDIKAEAERLRAELEARGAVPFEAEILQPAGALLDLYGEDIRARAFVTSDPLRGEMVLRPDFTVPLVQAHAANGAGATRYVYAGEVFRRQEDDASRPAEYQQVGFEVFGRAAAEADAEVFATFADLLSDLGLRAAVGDIGLLRAAIDGLSISDARKAFLSHHLWRPKRFRTMLGHMTQAPSRPQPKPPSQTAVEVGLRSRDEVLTRIEALGAERAEPLLSKGAVDLIDALLAVRGAAPNALAQLEDIAVDMPSIKAAVDRLAGRFEAIAARGVDIATLGFEASYGRTSLEYYDGFVFGFYADARPDLPPLATGGRYDALTRVLGGSEAMPAVGGVIRPGLILELTR